MLNFSILKFFNIAPVITDCQFQPNFTGVIKGRCICFTSSECYDTCNTLAGKMLPGQH